MSRKSTNCRRGNCQKTEAECNFAHSIHEWKPINNMCKSGEDCLYKETTCYYRHNDSFAEKLRLANFYGLKFHIKPVPIPMPEVPMPVVVEDPIPIVEDPLFLLQIEKASIQSEIELISLMKKKVELRMRAFKLKASNVWEVGSDDLEFKLGNY